MIAFLGWGTVYVCHLLPLTLALIILLIIRVVYVLYQSGKPLRSVSNHVSTLIVLGSGRPLLRHFGYWYMYRGHTAEMLNLIAVIPKERFSPRFYIAASTDNMSLQKARVFEETFSQEENIADKMGKASQFMQIYRSREVGQSYLTSVGTTLIAIFHAILLMIRIRPQVILCNGPGTCIPLCAVAFIFKVIGLQWSSIFYVESIARVKKLSLSGFLLYKLYLADQLFVQWPQLQRKYPRAHYVGRLM